MIASQLSGHCDVISNWLWCHQQNENWASETQGRCVQIVVFNRHFMDSLCRVRNELMYILSWRTVSALTQVLFWCLFPSLLCNLGNKHQNNTHKRWNSLSLEYIHYSIFSGCFWKVICTKFCHNISVIIWNITNKFSIEFQNWKIGVPLVCYRHWRMLPVCVCSALCEYAGQLPLFLWWGIRAGWRWNFM